MTNTLKANIRDTAKILKQLDEQSLLLIDSGARLLLARQRIEEKNETQERIREGSDAVLVS